MGMIKGMSVWPVVLFKGEHIDSFIYISGQFPLARADAGNAFSIKLA